MHASNEPRESRETPRARASGWAWARARLVRGWMAAGAVGLGLGTSPAYAVMLQPRNEARVERVAAGGQDVPPSPLIKPCDPLEGAVPSKELLETLEAASQRATPLEMLASVPEPVRSSIERALAGPARFHAALFGGELGAPPIVPMYQLSEAPAAGATVRALAGDGTVGFEASVVSTEALDLAAGARALGDPSRVVLAGEAAWNVSGVAMREGRACEFQGMVIAVTSREGLGHWLIIEQDTICGDSLAWDGIASADRVGALDEIAAWRAEVAKHRMLMALDITTWLRWCVRLLMPLMPSLALSCMAALLADRVLSNLIKAQILILIIIILGGTRRQ